LLPVNKNNPFSRGCFIASFSDQLFANVREQRHKPCLLDRRRKLALMLGAHMRVARVDDLCLARNEPAQKIDLFIVDILEVLRAEETLL
jgi:hypothetical protein